MSTYPFGDARPPFVHALLAATAALAVYVACCGDAFGQDACTVDVVYPGRTDSYASAQCMAGWQCYPDGCHTTALTLALPLQQSTLEQPLPYSVPDLPWPVGLADGDAVGSGYIVAREPIAWGNLTNPTPGYFVLMVADPIFADGGDQ